MGGGRSGELMGAETAVVETGVVELDEVDEVEEYLGEETGEGVESRPRVAGGSFPALAHVNGKQFSTGSS